jgi:hypothetical protein
MSFVLAAGEELVLGLSEHVLALQVLHELGVRPKADFELVIAKALADRVAHR